MERDGGRVSGKGWSCRQRTGVTAHVRSPEVGPIRVDIMTLCKAREIVLNHYFLRNNNILIIYLLRSGPSVQHVLWMYDNYT